MTAREDAENGMNMAGLGGTGVEGVWRGGIRPPANTFTGGNVAPNVNAEMLERFAGVHPGGPGGGGYNRAVNGAPNGGGVNPLGVLGTGLSLYGLGTGIYDMINGETTGDRVMGGVNATLGGIGSVGGIANMLNVSGGFLGGMTGLGGAGLGGGGLGGSALAGSTWFGTAAGGGGFGTAAGMGTALSTVGAVAGAGLAGYGLGTYGNAQTKRLGWFGQGDDGENRSASDWGADQAVSADNWVNNFIGGEEGGIRDTIGNGLGTVAGIGTVLGTSVVGGIASVGGAIAGAGGAIADGIGAVFSW